MIERVPIRDPEPLPYDAEQLVRKAYDPGAPSVDRYDGRRILDKALALVCIPVSEDSEWMVEYLQRKGLSRMVSRIIVWGLKKLCK